MHTYSNNSIYRNVHYTCNETDQAITVTYNVVGSFTHREPETESLLEVLQNYPFGLDQNAAAFICEYYPECIYTACEVLQYFPFHNSIFAQMTETEFTDYLRWCDCTETEYEDKYGVVIRDAAFSGVLVIGE